ncbi:hypothetical protein FRB98_001018 [Tulasnella sp. 332]|nr:hypothetical protein FRB98_001018 [Tulasnella sp. 332]
MSCNSSYIHLEPAGKITKTELRYGPTRWATDQPAGLEVLNGITRNVELLWKIFHPDYEWFTKILNGVPPAQKPRREVAAPAALVVAAQGSSSPPSVPRAGLPSAPVEADSETSRQQMGLTHCQASCAAGQPPPGSAIRTDPSLSHSAVRSASPSNSPGALKKKRKHIEDDGVFDLRNALAFPRRGVDEAVSERMIEASSSRAMFTELASGYSTFLASASLAITTILEQDYLVAALLLVSAAILYSPLLRSLATRKTGSQYPQVNESMSASGFKLVPRPNSERGNADHGWLKTFHTFSFANYWDPRFQSFGALRVINEDRVEASTGFGTHPHREMEIFSYIVAGELEHKDSMGNLEIMKRGDVQMTSAGTGIRHSEWNRNPEKEVHFLQIWVQPNLSRLEPKYFSRHFTDAEKTDTLLEIVAPVGQEGVSEERSGSGPTPIHSLVSLHASILTPGKTVSHTFKGSKGYVHLVQTSGYNTGVGKGNRIQLNGGLELGEGDGSFVFGAAGQEVKIENVGTTKAELLVFDMQE